MLNTNKINKLFHIFYEENPNPQTELEYTNTFTLLIAVLLSAQSTDKGVNKATKNLFEIADTPIAMLSLGYDGLVQHIKTIGLYKTKAQNILKTCEILIKNFKGEVPASREALESLPGVGRKTANVVLNIAFHQNTIAVDTHIFRVSRRIGLSMGTTPLQVELDLLQIIPENYMYNAHHWLILHGRYICKAQTPLCSQCPVRHLCNTNNQNISDLS